MQCGKKRTIATIGLKATVGRPCDVQLASNGETGCQVAFKSADDGSLVEEMLISLAKDR